MDEKEKWLDEVISDRPSPLSVRTILALLRRKEGISQRELARRAGVPQSTVARIESGKSDPTVGMVKRLYNAMDYGLTCSPTRAPQPQMSEAQSVLIE